jgi:hypothetical protein
LIGLVAELGKRRVDIVDSSPSGSGIPFLIPPLDDGQGYAEGPAHSSQ